MALERNMVLLKKNSSKTEIQVTTNIKKIKNRFWKIKIHLTKPVKWQSRHLLNLSFHIPRIYPTAFHLEN